MNQSLLRDMTGISGFRFANIVRDGGLPFEPRPKAPGKRADYSARDIFALALAIDFYTAGISWSAVGSIVRDAMEDLEVALRKAPGADAWIVFATFPPSNPDADIDAEGIDVTIVGTWKELAKMLEHKSVEEADGRPARLTVQVNASEVMRMLHGRASRHPKADKIQQAFDAIWSNASGGN